MVGGDARQQLHDQWLSSALIKLQVSHESPFLVGGAHPVAVALPQRRQALVVLGPDDLATPSRQPLGSSVLRRRQLEQLCWGCEELQLRDVKAAQKEGRLGNLLLGCAGLFARSPVAATGRDEKR